MLKLPTHTILKQGNDTLCMDLQDHLQGSRGGSTSLPFELEVVLMAVADGAKRPTNTDRIAVLESRVEGLERLLREMETAGVVRRRKIVTSGSPDEALATGRFKACSDDECDVLLPVSGSATECRKHLAKSA